jgi:hypothetical protein
MGSYEQLESERTFAENTYQHALQALDRSRINADRQQVYLGSLCKSQLQWSCIMFGGVDLWVVRGMKQLTLATAGI